MGNALRTVTNRFSRPRQERERRYGHLGAVAGRFLELYQNMSTDTYFKTKKARPNRRHIKYSNVDEFDIASAELIWYPVNPGKKIRVEFDPTVPNERFDEFDFLTLRKIAIELLSKNPMNYDRADLNAATAMTRYLNAERLAKWGSLVRDAGYTGDGLENQIDD